MRKEPLFTVLASLGFVNVPSWAFVLSPSSPWAEIRSTPNILVRAPLISFGGVAVSVLDVCRSDDKLRAKTSEGQTVEVPVGSTSQSYDIEVDRFVGGLRHIREIPLFTKQFTIPPCSEPGE